MSTNFYKIPQGIVNQLSSHLSLSGRLLLPCDLDGQLAAQLNQQQLDCDGYEKGIHIFDPLWWTAKQGVYDWVIANTTGLKEETHYVLDYGIAIANKGVIVLDRLSFLEPVAKRRKLFQNCKLSDLMIFSPRPQFSTVSKSRDSVTSAWFVFRQPKNWMDGTNIEFLVDWQSVPPLSLNHSA